jgi:hypothetical protein
VIRMGENSIYFYASENSRFPILCVVFSRILLRKSLKWISKEICDRFCECFPNILSSSGPLTVPDIRTLRSYVIRDSFVEATLSFSL